MPLTPFDLAARWALWMRTRRAHRLITCLLLALFAAWGVYSLQKWEEMVSVGGCESEGLVYVREIMADYAAAHSGRLPTREEARVWARQHPERPWQGSFPEGCNTGRYAWRSEYSSGGAGDFQPLVWCGRSHGLWYRWRNVIFADLSLRKVPEREFVQRTNGGPGRPVSSFEEINPNWRK